MNKNQFKMKQAKYQKNRKPKTKNKQQQQIKH